jgi:hypothetical protein
MPSKCKDDAGSNPTRKLPDAAICQARRADGPGMVFCLVDEPGDCKHAQRFDEAWYCLHPEREDIIARTKVMLWIQGEAQVMRKHCGG